MTSFSVKEITEYLNTKFINYKLSADENMMISSFCSLDQLKDDSITWVRFVEDVNPVDFMKRHNILLFVELDCGVEFDFGVLYVENVHSVFFQVIDHFFQQENPNIVLPKIESTATILAHEFGENLYVGYHSFIDKDVVIGNNVRIFNNVTIQGKVTIGDNCLIDSNTVIGATGYGHYIDNMGINRTAPHLGGVRIGNNVEIGCNSCIARGCLADTIIEDDVKIDSMCFVAHNVIIKKSVMVVAGTCIGGSTTVGERSWLGLNSTVSDQIVVSEDTYVGMSTLVYKTMSPNKVLFGVPARVLRENSADSKIKHKQRESIE